ncbi:ANTAR domain-containing protein [Auraticoccus cholistanensis]|uniref:ANTAR domain-containing protein n=1 Tax=Auraticoccus cholistanensis TaxID=2656650 RepID=UPI0012E75B22
MPLRRLGADEAFRADPTPKVVVDTGFVIRAVNPAYTRVSGREADELLSVPLFEAFPDNPDDPHADGVARVTASFERVLRTRNEHNMVIQRYDVADATGRFVPRHWVPVNSPIMLGDDIIGIVQQAKDVTVLRSDVLVAMEQYRDMLTRSAVRTQDEEDHRSMVDAYTEALAQFNTLADEVGQLREALTTRATIEQAKGMVMLSRGCGPEEAFDVLRRISQNTNVRLADVAATIIRQLQAAPAALRA